MSLTLVATPIGNPEDISIRAIKILQLAEIIFCESTKETSKLLKTHHISGKIYHEVSEHTTPSDLDGYIDFIKNKNCVLVSDCGTPSFCDPGFELVRRCRQYQLPVTTIPGTSSLMYLISLSSIRIETFYFRGFLSAENQLRQQQWNEVKKIKESIVLMDTPYRLKKIKSEIETHFPDRNTLWIFDATTEHEKNIEVMGNKISKQNWPDKAEFMVLIYPR